jgi:hypothetical protein
VSCLAATFGETRSACATCSFVAERRNKITSSACGVRAGDVLRGVGAHVWPADLKLTIRDFLLRLQVDGVAATFCEVFERVCGLLTQS